MSDRFQVSRRNPDGSRGRGVPGSRRVGRVEVTPTRAILTIAVAGSVGFVAYTLTIRDANQIPLLAAGFAVLGIVFSALAIIGATETYRSATEGRTARALGVAILGGLAAVVAFGCFAGAIVGALVART
ncbi:MAG: hypothetical protein ACYDAK_12750 [Candidatus Limnocylindrales bacterium]